MVGATSLSCWRYGALAAFGQSEQIALIGSVHPCDIVLMQISLEDRGVRFIN